MPAGRAVPTVAPAAAVAGAGSSPPARPSIEGYVPVETRAWYQAFSVAGPNSQMPDQGIAVIGTPPADSRWWLQRATATIVGQTGAVTGYIHVGSTAVQSRVDVYSGNGFAVSQEEPPVLIPPGNALIFVFDGLVIGGSAYGLMQLRQELLVPMSEWLAAGGARP